MEPAQLTGHAFWHFSFSVWKQPQIESGCLQLQNKYHLNINFILFSCWLAHEKYMPLDRATLQELLDLSKAWHDDIIVNLRAVRQLVKTQSLPDKFADMKRLVKQKVSEVELFAEKIEQALLFNAIHPLGIKKNEHQDSIEAAKINLQHYLAAENIKMDAADRAQLDSMAASIVL